MQDNNQTNDTSNTPPDIGNDVPNHTTTSTGATPEISTETNVLPVDATPAEVVASADSSTPVSTISTEAESAVETTSSGNSESQAVTSAALNKKQVLIQYGVATAVVLLIGVGLLYALEQQGRVSTGVFDKISSIVNPVAPVAIVNGTEISQTDYDRNIGQLQTAASAQGADVTDETVQAEIKKQAIDVLVNTELLRQVASAEGTLVTEEQVEARYQEIVESLGGLDQLAARMSELGITEPALRRDIEGEILIQGHLSKAVDVSSIVVTDQELTDAYAQISGTAATGITVPPLAEIKDQLEAQLRTNKEQELVNAYIEKIRTEAEIEVLI